MDTEDDSKKPKDISEMTKLTLQAYSRIDNIIPRNKVTLVTGLPGTGKTYSIIKFLNKHDITPIHINLDESTIGDLKADMYGENLVAPILTQKITGIKDRVVIFDTYQRLMDMYSLTAATTDKNLKIVRRFEQLSKECTVIVIAHPEDYVGKDSILKDNPILVRNCFEHLHLDSILPRGKTLTEPVYRRFIKKGRGIGGIQIYEGWMRS